MRGLLFAAVAGAISVVPDQAPQIGAGAGRFLSKFIRHAARAAAKLALTDFVLESSYGASVFALVRELIVVDEARRESTAQAPYSSPIHATGRIWRGWFPTTFAA